MRSHLKRSKTHLLPRLIAIAVLTGTVMSLQILCQPSASAKAANAWMGITVTNNATRDIRHLYLTPVDRDAWGPDLMSEGTLLRTGQTFTISDVTCSANEIKVVAEDGEGCFVYGVVSCAQATTSWTITNEAPRDCGN
jgi:hypothetical protein